MDFKNGTLALIAMTTVAACALGAPGCAIDEAPTGLQATPPGDGALVRFDMFHKPLPEIPLPNNLATWPDPTSRTGLRINASLIASTDIEQNSRFKMNQIEGWATFGWISMGFDMDDVEAGETALDLGNIRQRHQGDDFDLRDDAVYLVNLRTGVPVPLDIGEGSFNYTLRDKYEYWANDPRRSEQFLILETYDETAAEPGVTEYRPSLDTDFDGILDRPNLDDPDACPPPPANLDLPNDQQAARDRCIADHMLTWYERDTDTLLVSPVVPLDEMTEYAVVVTNRTLDSKGRTVRSPFEWVYHPMQQRGIERLREHLSNPALAGYYGDIGGTGLRNVAFTWTFTTQPVYDDLHRLRDGLYGHGPFSYLAQDFPPKLHLARAVGTHEIQELAEGADDSDMRTTDACQGKLSNLSIVHFEDIKTEMADMLSALGISGGVVDEVIASYEGSVDYLTLGWYNAPYFIEGGPNATDPGASFKLNFMNGEGEVHDNRIWFLVVVPKEGDGFKAPFPVALYNHGSGGNALESFVFAGNLARQGIATAAIHGVGHGLAVNKIETLLVRAVLKGMCLAPASDAMLAGRARDLDHDGIVDSGGDLWTAYFFHTRDVVRQTAMDEVQLIRAFRAFDGKRKDQDYDGDGNADLAGDFNADGVVDVGGPDAPYVVWGTSFGGIVASVAGAVDPYVTAVGANSGGGGMVNIGVRSNEQQVVNSIGLGLVGPLVVGRRLSDYGKPVPTKCKQEQISVRWVVPDLTTYGEVEIACVDPAALPAGGGTVLVHNRANGNTRCARSDAEGRFRVDIPASRGDDISIEMFDVPDNIDSYGTCNVVDRSHKSRQITTWELAFWDEGDYDEAGNVICHSSKGCNRFHGIEYGVGTQLVSLVDGFGYIRQTPSFRRLVGIGQTAVNAADPINFAPYYGLKSIVGPSGEKRPPRGFVASVIVGDATVPTYAGVALARAAGVVPFLAPDAAKQFPALSEYVTPRALYEALGNTTPNRALIDHHSLEGVNRLARYPADATCAPNQDPLSEASCHPACGGDLGTDVCLTDQRCIDGICQKSISELDCRNALFDVDGLDEGRSEYGQQRLDPALRLARIAARVSERGLETIWAPRLKGVPGAADDVGAWDASEPIAALVNPYLVPWGTHTFNVTDKCAAFDTGLYMANMMGRFFSTSGRDLVQLSHPATHHCLEDSSCDFFRR